MGQRQTCCSWQPEADAVLLTAHSLQEIHACVRPEFKLCLLSRNNVVVEAPSELVILEALVVEKSASMP